MKKITLLLIAFTLTLCAFAQAPQGLSYQAVARDSQGNQIRNKNLSVQISIYSDNNVIWTENHSVLTSEMGLFSLVIGDQDAFGEGTAGSFNMIDWGNGFKEIGIAVDDGTGMVEMGRSPFQSVPYALYSVNGPDGGYQDLSLDGNILTLSGDPTPGGIDLGTISGGGSSWTANVDSISTLSHVAIGSRNPNKVSLAVQGLNNEPETPLFEVRREDGVPVFAVFNDGVMVYVDESVKGVKGGFAVGGYKSTSKGLTQEYLRVTADSVRIYVPENLPGKGIKGGFAVGGFKQNAKGISQDLLYVTPDSIRMYVPNKENDPGVRGLQGGFAVQTFDPAAVAGDKSSEYIMGMNRGITRFNTADNRKGFAIGSQGEGWSSTYMQVTPVNTFVGFESGKDTRNDPNAWNANQGSMNLFLGYKSGQNNKYGHHNIFMGDQAGWSMVGDSLDDYDHSNNILIGPQAGISLVNGGYNTMMGSQAGAFSTSGYNNTYIGMSAGKGAFGVDGGSNNVAVGYFAGGSTISSNNLMLGYYSGANSSTGSENVYLGPWAGQYNYEGSRNIFIGASAGEYEAGSNLLYIENSNSSIPLIWGDFNTDQLRFNASVGINTAVSENRFTVTETRTGYGPAAIAGYNQVMTNGQGIGVEGTGGWTGVLGYAYNTGTGYRNGLYGSASGGDYNYGVYGYAYGGTAAYAVYASGNLGYSGSLVGASDQKFKENVQSINSVMDNLMKVQPRSYTVVGSEQTKSYGMETRSQYGFVAQELELVFPELVVEVVHQSPRDPNSKGPENSEVETYKGVKYIEMIPILLKGMQEQQDQIEDLKREIETLKAAQ